MTRDKLREFWTEIRTPFLFSFLMWGVAGLPLVHSGEEGLDSRQLKNFRFLFFLVCPAAVAASVWDGFIRVFLGKNNSSK